MVNSIWKRLGRWLGGPESESAPPELAGEADQSIYERTPRRVVAFAWEAPEGPAPGASWHVDGVGVHRVVCGTRFLFASGGVESDLQLGGEGLAAGLALRTSLSGGASWVLCPLAEQPITIDGAPVAGPTVLSDGDSIRFAERVELGVRLPDPASAACVLENLCEGEVDTARRTLLLPPGTSGRARVGSTSRAHVQTSRFETPLFVEFGGTKLRLVSDVPFTHGAGAPVTELDLPFPPARLEVVSMGSAEGARPPFELSFAPLA